MIGISTSFLIDEEAIAQRGEVIGEFKQPIGEKLVWALGTRIPMWYYCSHTMLTVHFMGKLYCINSQNDHCLTGTMPAFILIEILFSSAQSKEHIMVF